MPLKIGTWSASVAGLDAELVIESVSEQGHVKGSLKLPNAVEAVVGIWDETARRISFMSQRRSPIRWPEYFEGFLHSEPANPEPGADVQWTLMGTVQLIEGSQLVDFNTNVRRAELAWSAKIKETF